MIRARAAAALLVLVGAGWAVPAHAAPPSTTTLVLSSPSSAYGQTVTATAQVATAGTADGDVYFAVDGTSVKANLNGGGTATLTLPREAAAGEHAVSATFVPRFPDRQAPSSSSAVAWTVSRASTLLEVRVTGRGLRIPTSVVITSTGEYGTRPSGALIVTVRQRGTGKVVRRTRTLDTTGAATARLGILRAGSYRLRVAYAGDGQHLAARWSGRFAVGQR